MEPEVGKILEGKVTSILKFGAFVALEGGRSGLVQISEIAPTYVNDVHDFLQEGQTVRVKVLSTENGKINLSIKKALPQEERPRSFRPAPPRGDGAPRPAPQRGPARPAAPPVPQTPDQIFEDKLKQFMTASEGRMADLNRGMDGRRGRRRK